MMTLAIMSRIIIVKLERLGDEVMAHNFDRRYEQRIVMTAEVDRILRQRPAAFAEARLRANGELIVLKRARERQW